MRESVKKALLDFWENEREIALNEHRIRQYAKGTRKLDEEDLNDRLTNIEVLCAARHDMADTLGADANDILDLAEERDCRQS